MLETSGYRLMPWAAQFWREWYARAKRECLSHFLCFSLGHLDHIGQEYVRFHNEHRPHQGLDNQTISTAAQRVRPEMQKRCLTADGLWVPKSRAARRPIHITDRMARLIGQMGLGEPSDWLFVNEAGNQIAENKTLQRLKKYALAAKVLVEPHPRTGKPWSRIRWHWLRHYHRTRACVSKIRREVSKVAMGHAADAIHDHYRGLDRYAFHEEYAKFDSGIDDRLLGRK